MRTTARSSHPQPTCRCSSAATSELGEPIGALPIARKCRRRAGMPALAPGLVEAHRGESASAAARAGMCRDDSRLAPVAMSVEQIGETRTAALLG